MITYQLCTIYRWAEESSNFRVILQLTLTCDERGLVESEMQSVNVLFHERLGSTWGERTGTARSSRIELFDDSLDDLKLLVAERIVQTHKRIEEIVLLNRRNKKLCENTGGSRTYFI